MGGILGFSLLVCVLGCSSEGDSLDASAAIDAPRLIDAPAVDAAMPDALDCEIRAGYALLDRTHPSAPMPAGVYASSALGCMQILFHQLPSGAVGGEAWASGCGWMVYPPSGFVNGYAELTDGQYSFGAAGCDNAGRGSDFSGVFTFTISGGTVTLTGGFDTSGTGGCSCP